MFEVTSLDDSGPNTLRQAILDANTSPGEDSIVFNFSGAGPHTIAPTTALPGITEAIIIDGTSQAGYAGTPLIEINGAGAGASSSGLLLDSGSNGSTIKGLKINKFSFGIFLLSSNNSISENFVGTDPLGTTDLGNLESGVFVQFGSNGNLIRDNLVSGNDGTGILLTGNNNRVEGNKIGTNAAGTAALANSRGATLPLGRMSQG